MQALCRSLVTAFLVALTFAAPATAKPPASVPAPPLPLATPASQGLSAERLARLHAGVQAFIDDGRHAGAITLIARNGKVVDWQTYGQRDLEARLPMEKDTICRIYSMSKIVTSVAVLTLLEEARFRLDDPIANFLPALGRMKVLTGGTPENPQLADARTPITIRHLLTHTSGLTYDFGDGTIDKIFRQVKPLDAASLNEFVERASRLPLAHEPGERFTYGVSTDVLGALVEKVAGRPFDEFLQQRILGPLGMKDTAFSVPESKRGRLARIYGKPDGDGSAGKGLVEKEAVIMPKFPSGGGGLYSTSGDYVRFMQMLLNGGHLDGAHILSPKTVELMTANHLSLTSRPYLGDDTSEGFGLGGSVRLDLAKGKTAGSVGQFGWSGMATTYANLDATEKTVALLFVQHLPYDQHKIFWRFSTLFYQSIVGAGR